MATRVDQRTIHSFQVLTYSLPDHRAPQAPRKDMGVREGIMIYRGSAEGSQQRKVRKTRDKTAEAMSSDPTASVIYGIIIIVRLIPPDPNPILHRDAYWWWYYQESWTQGFTHLKQSICMSAPGL